ncbi:MAG: HAD family phosphatase [Chloroflexi bacterium]|nr:HAD family phosphatase [Chloroflexota bacterium]
MQPIPNPPNPPKLVIFDCDGVLVDSPRLVNQAILRVLASYGLQLTLDEVLKNLKGLLNADIRDVVASRWGVALPENFTDVMEDAEWAAMEEGLLPVEDAETAVRAVVASGVATCVASNGPLKDIEHRLRLTGLFSFFEGRLFSAYTVPRAKPHPDVFLHAASTMGYPPSECAVIEDSDPGIQAALAAGMRVLAYAATSDTTFADAAGVQTFTDMTTLPALLGL